MEKFKRKIEAVIRETYGLHPEMVVSDIDIKFNVSTGSLNGLPDAGLTRAISGFPKQGSEPATFIRKKVRKGVSRSLHRDYTTSKEDIFCIRAFFSKWKKDKLFTESELIFFEQTEGVFYKRLSQETKQKMREVFEDVRTRVLFAKKNRTEPASV